MNEWVTDWWKKRVQKTHRSFLIPPEYISNTRQQKGTKGEIEINSRRAEHIKCRKEQKETNSMKWMQEVWYIMCEERRERDKLKNRLLTSTISIGIFKKKKTSNIRNVSSGIDPKSSWEGYLQSHKRQKFYFRTDYETSGETKNQWNVKTRKRGGENDSIEKWNDRNDRWRVRYKRSCGVMRKKWHEVTESFEEDDASCDIIRR